MKTFQLSLASPKLKNELSRMNGGSVSLPFLKKRFKSQNTSKFKTWNDEKEETFKSDNFEKIKGFWDLIKKTKQHINEQICSMELLRVQGRADLDELEEPSSPEVRFSI